MWHDRDVRSGTRSTNFWCTKPLVVYIIHDFLNCLVSTFPYLSSENLFSYVSFRHKFHFVLASEIIILLFIVILCVRVELLHLLRRAIYFFLKFYERQTWYAKNFTGWNGNCILTNAGFLWFPQLK